MNKLTILVLTLNLFILPGFAFGMGYLLGVDEVDQITTECNTALSMQDEVYLAVKRVNEDWRELVIVTADLFRTSDTKTFNELDAELRAKIKNIEALTEVAQQKATAYEQFLEESLYIQSKAE